MIEQQQTPEEMARQIKYLIEHFAMLPYRGCEGETEQTGDHEGLSFRAHGLWQGGGVAACA